MSKRIQIVDEADQPVSSAKIISAYQQGLRHRVARIFVFNQDGELFLQRRAAKMGTFPNLWDQSVGGLVDAGETYESAAIREAEEEIGLPGLQLTEVARYYAEDSHERYILRRFNCLFAATTDQQPTVDQDEVSDGRWITLATLDREIHDDSDRFTPGLIKALEVYNRVKPG